MRMTFGIITWLLTIVTAHGQIAPKPMVRVALTAETATVTPGQQFWVAIEQTIAPGWHTYWINPGDAGESMALDWRLPDGFQAGDIQWPLPETIPVASLLNYGYSGRATLLVKMQAPQAITGDKVVLSAKARWLVCEDVCIPEQGDISLTLAVAQTAASAMASAEAGDIARHASRLPVEAPWRATLATSVDRAVVTVQDARAIATEARFFPLTWGHIDNAAAQKVSVSGAALTIDMQRGELKDQKLDEMKGLLVLGSGEARKGYWISAKTDGRTDAPIAGDTGVSVAAVEGGGDAVGIGFFAALLFAAVGGLILNLMPCVFPVLSLKAVSLAGQSRESGRAHGLAYFAGVMASFAALAVLLIAVRASGVAVGWGFQFQSPVFVLAMAAIFLALGLSLSGVFHIAPGLAGAGDAMTRREGSAGYFFTGVLATIAATPCTAPFMGAALGYAFSQPPLETVAVLLALGAGFAAPMTALSFTPQLRRAMPRPGAWMETLKQLMAFPLYATAAWLVWVLSVQRGSDGVLAAALALFGVGFSCWLWSKSDARIGQGAALATAVIALVFASSVIPAAPLANGDIVAQGSGPKPEAYSPAKLAALRAEGRAVFVNFTAAWCITCKANERLALSSARVAKAFEAANVAYLKADWTNYDADITSVLQSFGRAGVPLYVLYPPRGAVGGAQILPQILTEAVVIERLSALPTQQATGDLSHARN